MVTILVQRAKERGIEGSDLFDQLLLWGGQLPLKAASCSLRVKMDNCCKTANSRSEDLDGHCWDLVSG